MSSGRGKQPTDPEFVLSFRLERVERFANCFSGLPMPSNQLIEAHAEQPLERISHTDTDTDTRTERGALKIEIQFQL